MGACGGMVVRLVEGGEKRYEIRKRRRYCSNGREYRRRWIQLRIQERSKGLQVVVG